MPLMRVTVTLPPDLVKRADRLARQQAVSRSAVLARALQAYAAEPPDRATVPGRVAEPRLGWGAERRGTLSEVSNQALLDEVHRRLAPTAAVRGAAPGDQVNLGYDRANLAELCRRHHIRRLSLFGSVLRDDFGPESDVDVLVEFEPGLTPGLGITDIEDELSALFGGRRVDLVTEKSLHRLVRDRVLASAVLQYAA